MAHRPEEFDDSAFQAAVLDDLKRGDLSEFDDNELEQAVAQRLIVDVEKLKISRARRIIKAWHQEGTTIQVGMLWLPGLEPQPNEPLRLVANGKGQSIELDRAPLEFRQAELERKRVNLDAVSKSYKKCVLEVSIFESWAKREADAGRLTLDLTWGNCIRETGLWRPVDGVTEAA
jgi:hypothetical protein